MTVAELLRDMDSQFMLDAMWDFFNDPTLFMADVNTLIEGSPPLRQFLQSLVELQDIDAVVGASATLAFLCRRLELKEVATAWLTNGLFSRCDSFFENQALSLVAAPVEFSQRAQHLINDCNQRFRGFLLGTAIEDSPAFSIGATAMIELLLRSEEVDRANLN